LKPDLRISANVIYVWFIMRKLLTKYEFPLVSIAVIEEPGEFL